MGSIDDFLSELFSPGNPGTGALAGLDDRFGGGNPLMPQGSSFDDRFSAAPAGGGLDLSARERLAGNAMPNTLFQPAPQDPSGGGTPPQFPGSGPGSVPMPQPRPPGAPQAPMVAGDGSLPPQFPGGVVPQPQPRPDAAGPSAADLNMTPPGPVNPVNSAFARLAGMGAGPPGAPGVSAAAPEQAKSLLGRLAGMDANGDNRFRSALAGGFAGGNPAFAGGAFMKGAGGGVAGTLKSDKEAEDKDIAATTKAQAQSNFDRTQGDKEKTSDALRKLYGQRGDALVTNATTRANTPPKTSTAWNKPPNERYKDAMRLIQSERKQAYQSVPPYGAQRDKAQAAADAHMKEFTDQTLRAYGIDANGGDISGKSGASPSTSKMVGDKEGEQNGMYDGSARGQAIDAARTAIAQGANRDQVIGRLKDHGITATSDELE